MNDAPERIVIAGTLDECGSYYPSAVEAEGEHGGFAVEYLRADIADELLEALQMADAALSGANMDMKAVERKARAAIARATNTTPTGAG